MKKILFLLLALPFIGWANCFAQLPKERDAARQLKKFSEFYSYLASSYVDSVDYESIMETAIKNVLEDLDPHSSYISASDMEGVFQSLEGNFSGIGIEFNVLRDTVLVVNTIPGGPAEMVGMQPNDRIITIDDESAIGISQGEVRLRLRGERGSNVTVEVARKSVEEPLVFRITRDNIPVSTIDAAYKVDDRTGYIKINRFANLTMNEFSEAFVSMGNIDGLILDLRGNSGGLMNKGVSLAGFFLPRGSLIVSTEGLRVKTKEYFNEGEGPFTGRLIVLIDEFSASASEIVAGALQDWDRAVIVGRRSFGKGLVQRQFMLSDQSAVRITVARYHTPTGRGIQRPYTEGDKSGYYDDLAARIASDTDSTDLNAEKFQTLKLGRTVYASGGINPDIHVAIDTVGYNQYYRLLIRHGIFNEYVSNYLEENRSDIKENYPNFEHFNSSFVVSKEMIEEMNSLVRRDEIPYTNEELNESYGRITNSIKALIARRLWGMNEYNKIYRETGDATYKEALDIMNEWQVRSSGIVYDIL